jgi:hypothetical protein
VVADAPASNRRRDKEMSIMVRLPIRYVPGGEQWSAHRKTTPTHRQVHRCPCSKIYPCGTQFAGADVD